MQHPHRPTLSRVLATLLLAWLSATAALSQPPPDDEQTRLLEVRRRQIELREARTRTQRTQELFDQGLSSANDLERSEAELARTQVNYQAAVLSLLRLEPRISVEQALKYRSEDGLNWVRIQVRNLTPIFDDSRFQLLNNFDGVDPLPSELRTRDVSDVFISLKDPGGGDPGDGAPPRGTTIALPYEVHIPKLAYGEAWSFDLQLLRNVSSVTVALTHKGLQQEIDVLLQQAESESPVTLSATQISLEADLGAAATFELRLDRSSVDSQGFQLQVLGLPPQIDYSFVDPASQARLSQINFPAGVTQQRLQLRLFLPERTDQRLEIDQPLRFLTAVADPSQTLAREGSYTTEQLRAERVGFLALELIPRGVGRIEVSAPSLYASIQAGERVASRLSVRNTGSRRLDNVQLTAQAPYGWQVEFEPAVVPALDVRQEQMVELRLLPPADITVGDYEVRIKTASSAFNQQVPTEDKLFRINVKEKANLVATGGLFSLLLGLLGGLVTFGIKIARR